MPPLTHVPEEAGRRRHEPVSGLVSVVVPAFNAERWLGATLAGVREQTYRPLEIIVVDDGSTDGTAALAAGSVDVALVRTSGAGPGGARNAGLAAARGEYIQFLDADDLLAPGKVARQVPLLRASDADVAWEPFHHLSPVAGSDDTFELGPEIRPELGTDIAASLLTTCGFVQLGAMLVRRSPRTDRVWFSEERGAVEDVRYAVELALGGARFVCSESGELGLLYRQHAGPRYSTRPIASFARGCAANARWVQAQWERSGGLTEVRRTALGEAYAFAARQLAAVDSTEFADAAARGVALGPGFTRSLPTHIRWLSRLVGYPWAETIATRWRRLRGRPAGPARDAVTDAR